MNERPIFLTGAQIRTVRAGRRKHLCMTASMTGGHRDAAERLSAARMPSVWTALQPGDRLWVREDICELLDTRNYLNSQRVYRVDCEYGYIPIPAGDPNRSRWRQRVRGGFHMERRESRYTLLVKAIRIFPCQEISWEEIDAEAGVHYPTDSKGQWWGRSYGLVMPWYLNPRVVGISFEFIDANIDGHAPPFAKPAAPAPAASAAEHDRQRRLLDKSYGGS